MKALKADFAFRRPIGAWPWVVLILMLGAFTAYQGWHAWTQQAHVRALQQERASLAQQLDLANQAHRDASARLSIRPAYATDAAAVAKTAGFPLDRVLSSIESVQVPGVKVTSLEISASEGTVHAELEFADHTALLGYLEEINAGEPTRRWMLLQAQIASSAGASSVGTIVSSWETGTR